MSIKNHIIEYQENMQITEPCIIRNMPIGVYHGISGISTSGIKLLLDCPAKYYYKYLSGQYQPEERKDLKIGKACHSYILEGKDAFMQTYWHNPYFGLDKQSLLNTLKERFDLIIDKDFEITAAQKINDSFQYRQQKRDLLPLLKDFDTEKPLTTLKTSEIVNILLSLDGIERKEVELNSTELNQVVNMARAINDNEFAKNAFNQEGESELSIFWVDEATGLWLKCRPDFLPYDCEDVADYKTTKSASPTSFFNDFIKFGYHQQAAFYKWGINEATKALLGSPKEVEHFFFVAQEKEAPHITQIYFPCEVLVDHGLNAVKKALEIYLNCQETGIWQTYTQRIIEISLSPKPDDLYGNFDEENGIIFAPNWVDGELMKYL